MTSPTSHSRPGRRGAAVVAALGAAFWLLSALAGPPRPAEAVLGQVTVAPPVAAPAESDLVPGRVIVKLRPGATIPAAIAQSTYGAVAVEDLPGLGVQRWSVAAGAERDVAGRLAARPEVE